MPVQADFLRLSQNPDGGWGFFPDKQSWLEPTAYALIALQGAPGFEHCIERGWDLVRSWQLADGSWPACAAVREPHWTTALAVTLHCERRVYDDRFRAGTSWLLGVAGVENGLEFRIAHLLRPSVVELDPSFKAWPWRPGTTSWIEPTAHTLAALKKASHAFEDSRLRSRVEMGEKMILERRCSDGGWNYGNRRVLGADLPSYEETTAIALVGLTGRGDLAGPLEKAKNYLAATRSPLAKAWLRVALRSHSQPVPLRDERQLSTNDVIIHALELMAQRGTWA